MQRTRSVLASPAVLVAPVVVYQMAKVGSSSVYEALKALGLPVFHVHRMNRAHLDAMRARRRELGWQVGPMPPHDLTGLGLQASVFARGKRARIITLVRDPIARNLSAYFEHLHSIWHSLSAWSSLSMEEICRGFHERFPHDEPLTWFDDELLPVTGIDIYAHPFPSEGILTLRERRHDLLALRSELPDEVKATAVARFLDLPNLTLRPENVTATKPKGEAYRRFLAHIRLDASYVDRLLDARYTRHFYTDEQRAAMRTRWLG